MKRIISTCETDVALRNIVVDAISDYKLERADAEGPGQVFGAKRARVDRDVEHTRTNVIIPESAVCTKTAPS